MLACTQPQPQEVGDGTGSRACDQPGALRRSLVVRLGRRAGQAAHLLARRRAPEPPQPPRCAADGTWACLATVEALGIRAGAAESITDIQP